MTLLENSAPGAVSRDETRLPRRALTVTTLLAVVVRVAMLLFIEQRPAMFDFPDAHRYARVAQHVAAGRGPIDDERVRSGTDPLFPFILALAPRLGFTESDAIMRFGRICNCAFGVLSILLLCEIGRGLAGPRVGLIAAFVLAFDPILLFFNGLVLTESLYIMLLLGAVLSLLRALDSLREPGNHTSPVAWALSAGLLMGAATLTRSTNILLPLILAPLFAWRGVSMIHASALAERMPRGGILKLVAAFLISAYFVLLPVLIRNYAMFHRVVPTRIGGGASLMEAFGPWADGAPGMDRIVYPSFPPGADELKRDDLCRKAAIDWIAAHPGRAVRLALRKLMRTWSIELNAAGYQSPLLRAICWATVGPEFALAAVGLWMLRRRVALLAMLLAPAAYFTLIHMVFVGSVRYRLPGMPFLFIMASVALAAILKPRRAKASC